MSNTNAKALRIDYHNQWPATFKFPIEQSLLLHMKRLNVGSPLVPARLQNSVDRDFHLMLSSLMDSLDSLPLRPDRAFEAIWTALDAEMVDLVVRCNPSGSPSRFQVLMDHVETHFAGAQSLQLLVDFVAKVPMQSCEYVAVRILEAMNTPGNHSNFFLKKVRPAMGQVLLDAFNSKYGSQWLGASGKQQGIIQRKAGAFLRKVLTGAEVTIPPITTYTLLPQARLRFFVLAILPNVRNERFHGLNFSSYRSSAAQMKMYAAGYFLFLVAYFLLIHVFLYRGFGVLTPQEASDSIEENSTLYARIFARFSGD